MVPSHLPCSGALRMGPMVPTPARVLGRSQLAREEALGLPHKPYRKAGQQRRLWSCVVATGTLSVLPIWAQKAGGATEAGHRLPAAPTNPAVLSQPGMPRGKPAVPQRRAPCPLMEKAFRGQGTAPSPPPFFPLALTSSRSPSARRDSGGQQQRSWRCPQSGLRRAWLDAMSEA